MSFCFSFFGSQSEDSEPLLPQYDDETSLQRALHQKLHSYQMIQALSRGYMPSNEQIIINIRTLLASDVFQLENPDLSDSGRLLVKHSKQWLHQFIHLLQNKNNEDQMQDFIWTLSRSRVTVDMGDLAQRASNATAKADTVKAYRSLQTVGSLLLSNSDFRIFLSDLNAICRDVFKDTAFKLSEVAEDTGKKIEPSPEELKKLQGPGADAGPPPSRDSLTGEMLEVSKAVGDGAAEVLKETESSILDKFSGDEKQALIYRLKQAIGKLRRRPDYNESVSTISLLIKQYAHFVRGTVLERTVIYSEAVKDAVKNDVSPNQELSKASKNFWALLSSFGERKEWDKLESQFQQLMRHRQNDAEFDELMNEIGDSIESLFTDPSSLDHAEEKFQDINKRYHQNGIQSSLKNELDEFLAQMQKTLNSAMKDKDIAGLLDTSEKILKILSPHGNYANGELIADTVNVFVPLLVQMVQYVPIPRLEMSTSEMDLLLENLIIEPGKTVNNTSFLPYRLRIESYNDLEIRKARFGTSSSISSMVTIKIDGLSIRADDVGFWFRAHSGIFRIADEGIASFELDERGIDIHIDVEIGKDRLEKIISLKAVRVHVHKLSYTIKKSRFSFLGWLFKPFLRSIIRKVIEKKLAKAIANALHAANRELVYARERLRATRISDPKDIRTFIKAVLARLTPEPDPDVYARVGVAEPGHGVFQGVYAPGSVVKLWNEQASHAEERIEDNEREGWRNDIFDVHAMNMV